ncbi:MAG: hypothetical protein JWM30_1866 [Burkholderia sp.]|nr:hypothetical protein [Burkholderia sp.]
MRKKTSTEEYLTIADRHIEAAEQRIRKQKRSLFDMATRGEDVTQKSQFLVLLRHALHSMQRYRAEMADSGLDAPAPGAAHEASEKKQQSG